jgi:hypothetical protein
MLKYSGWQIRPFFVKILIDLYKFYQLTMILSRPITSMWGIKNELYKFFDIIRPKGLLHIDEGR